METTTELESAYDSIPEVEYTVNIQPYRFEPEGAQRYDTESSDSDSDFSDEDIDPASIDHRRRNTEEWQVYCDISLIFHD